MNLILCEMQLNLRVGVLYQSLTVEVSTGKHVFIIV